MPVTNGTALVRAAIEGFLETSYGAAEVDGEGDFVVRSPRAVTWVRPQPIDDDHTAVIVFSPVAVGVDVSGDLTRFLATESLELPFAHFELHERSVPMVVVSHTLLGEFLSREELSVAVDEVSSAAARFRSEITTRFGGGLPSRHPKNPAAVRPQRPKRSTSAARPPQRRIQNTGVALEVVGFLAAVVAAAIAERLTGSWWLAGFVFLMAWLVVGRAVPEVVVESDKLRRLGFFAALPASCIAFLVVAQLMWDQWWLSSLIGLVLGAIVSASIALLLFEDIAVEEMAQFKEPDRRGFLAGGLS